MHTSTILVNARTRVPDSETWNHESASMLMRPSISDGMSDLILGVVEPINPGLTFACSPRPSLSERHSQHADAAGLERVQSHERGKLQFICGEYLTC